jgi:hypothetical protein
MKTIVITGKANKIDQLFKELIPRAKYDKVTVEMGAEIADPKDMDYLLKMSVSEITKKLESLSQEEIEFLKEKDDRIGIKKLFV